MKSIFTTCLAGKWLSSLEELGYEQQPLVNDGGTANYRIEIVETNEDGFKAQAIARLILIETVHTMYNFSVF